MLYSTYYTSTTTKLKIRRAKREEEGRKKNTQKKTRNKFGWEGKKEKKLDLLRLMYKTSGYFFSSSYRNTLFFFPGIAEELPPLWNVSVDSLLFRPYSLVASLFHVLSTGTAAKRRRRECTYSTW